MPRKKAGEHGFFFGKDGRLTIIKHLDDRCELYLLLLMHVGIVGRRLDARINFLQDLLEGVEWFDSHVYNRSAFKEAAYEIGVIAIEVMNKYGTPYPSAGGTTSINSEEFVERCLFHPAADKLVEARFFGNHKEDLIPAFMLTGRNGGRKMDTEYVLELIVHLDELMGTGSTQH